MTYQPQKSKEQAQEPTPPPQTKTVETPVLQTPLNDERGKKRDRKPLLMPVDPRNNLGLKDKD